ncbi:MAG: molybdenum cofactor guanylyltransferase [Planctomycetota bacterium]
MDFTGLVLAGGLATRMDGEKPLRFLHGKTLLQHSIDLMRPFVHEVIVCSGSREFDLPANIRQVKDAPEWATKGPLAGILAGLEAATCRHVILLPCDIPLLGQAIMKHLRGAVESSGCAFVSHQGYAQPLIAGMKTADALPVVRKSLQTGQFRVVPIWKQLKGVELALDVGDGILQSEREFLNINTLEDLDESARE